MSAPESLQNAVRSVLKTKARKGITTKSEAVLDVMRRIENAGGPSKFGIGPASMLMVLREMVNSEVTRQLKMPMTEHEQTFQIPATTPRETIAALGRVPRWLATGEGSETKWVFALTATQQDWMRNAEMKEKKAKQTETRANYSMDIARFLSLNGFDTLEEALQKGV